MKENSTILTRKGSIKEKYQAIKGFKANKQKKADWKQTRDIRIN